MTILDKYALKQFIVNLLFGLITFIFIFIVVDTMENMDNYIDSGMTLVQVLQYYFYFTPEIIKLMMPVSILLSSLFTTGKMSSFNELTAIKSSGVSAYRFLVPFIIFGVFISAFSTYFNGWVVPYSNKKKLQIDREKMHRKIEHVNKDNLYLQDGYNCILCLGYLDDQNNTATKISLQYFSDTNLTELTKRYDAQQMIWSETNKNWTLKDAIYREFTDKTEKLSKLDSITLNLKFDPEQIRKEQQKPDEMNYFELGEFIKSKKNSGYDVSKWLVEYYSKISFPFANFIVILFGIPFALNKKRAGLSIQFGISLLVCFLYLVFMKVSQVFGYNGDIHPMLTAWLANIIFFSAAIVNLIRIKK